MTTPLIIEYLELLHKYQSPSHRKVRKFVRAHAFDEQFVRRARIVRAIFVMSKKEKDEMADDLEEKTPCTHCGWAMGEREGEPLCDHCKVDVRS